MSTIIKLWLLLFLVRVESCQHIFRQFYTTLQWIHHRKSTPDLIFGLSVAKGVLMTSNYSHGARHVDFCSSLQSFPEEFPVYNRIALNAVACGDHRINRHLLSNLLNRRVDGVLPKTLASYLADIDGGTPSRELSDVCMAQVLSTQSCVISNQCMEIISANEKSTGYHKTHQILFALLLASQNCDSQLAYNLSIRVVLTELCSSVLKEVTTIIAIQFPELLRDLVLEQTLFCGLAGFTEFFSRSLVNRILSWQTKVGCFASTNLNEERACSQHMTGLGIAYASLIIKHFGSL